MTTRQTLLAPGPDWDETLTRFHKCGLDDIYFDHRYFHLYANDANSVRAFVFDDKNGLFCLPFICSKISDDYTETDTYDFETAYGYTGPLSTTDNPDFLKSAWRAFQGYCRDTKIVVGLLRFHPLLENQRFIDPSAVSLFKDRKTVFMDLDQSEDSVWNGYSSENRNKIRKSIKSGVHVKCSSDYEALTIFSSLYERHMSELNAEDIYFFGENYFKNILSLGADRFKVYLAERNGEIIGGALILMSNRFVHYHLSSSLREQFKFAPNNFLRHSVILDFLNKKWESIHFGGGRSADENDSLYRFKKQFSKQVAQFHIGRFVADNDLYQKIRRIWSKRHPNSKDAFGNRILCYRYF